MVLGQIFPHLETQSSSSHPHILKLNAQKFGVGDGGKGFLNSSKLLRGELSFGHER
jgi:hypothetical protein